MLRSHPWPKIKAMLLEDRAMSQAPVRVSANGYVLDLPFDSFWQRMYEVASYLLWSLCLSLFLSLLLSLVSYWFSVTFGVPVFPFFLIVI
ncbi:MAG: hypothetical protein D6676_10130 [Cyanobacteria bacterium J003]|jgi:hypothetical protein|nr:MAG: hypothetical protein D6676_10130 [Cyanobacteria bacterium J003]